MRLSEELGLIRDFDVPAHEGILNIYYTVTRLKKRAQDFFRDAGITDVQFNLLMLLSYQSGEEGGLTQAKLSRMLLVNRANITSLIDRMEKADLVHRASRPGDRRFNVIKLTDHGEKLLRSLEGSYIREVRSIMGALEEEELAQLLKTLEKIRNNLNGLDRRDQSRV